VITGVSLGPDACCLILRDKADYSLVRWAAGTRHALGIPIKEPCFVARFQAGRRRIYVANARGDGLEVDSELTGTFMMDEIWRAPPGPKQIGQLTRLNTVGNQLVAVGMGRQVYVKAARWIRQDTGILHANPISAADVRAIFDVDGATAQDLWAVGYKGEVHHFAGGTWTETQAETNGVLAAVHRIPESGEVWVGGSWGALFRRDGDAWTRVGDKRIDGDVNHLASLGGTLFVGTPTKVYRMIQGEIGPTHLAEESVGPLHAGDGALWSFGRKPAWTRDGETWTAFDVGARK
jgi:hypothetical protein